MKVCGRDQTPFGAAPGWTCTRQLGHEPPCAMVPPPDEWWPDVPPAQPKDKEPRPFMRWFDKHFRRFFT